MLKIRLQKTGRKHESTFRLVVTDSKDAARSGKPNEVLGSYNPRFDKPEINQERVLHWMKNGAQVSDSVYNLFVNAGIVKGKKKNVLPKKSPIVDLEAIKAKEEAEKAEAEKKAREEAEKAAVEAKAKAEAEEKAKAEAEAAEKAREEAKKAENPQ